MEDISRYRTFFIDSAMEWLVEMENGLCKFEQYPQDKDLLNDIFRIVHNIKGVSNTVGYHNFSSFVHHVEDILYRLRQDELSPDKALINVMLDSVDIIRDMVESYASKSFFDFTRCKRWIAEAEKINSGLKSLND